MSKPLFYRELRSWHLDESERLSPEMLAFADTYLWPLLGLDCTTATEPSRKATVAHIAHDLIATGQAAGVVADSRNTAQAGTRRRIEIWEAFIAAGLCRKCTGSEQSRRVTRYRATGELLDMAEILGTGLIAPVCPDDVPIKCHTGRFDPDTGEALPEDEQRQPLTFAEALYRTVRTLRESDGKFGRAEVTKYLPTFQKQYMSVVAMLNRINASNMTHGWQAPCRPDLEQEDREYTGNRLVDARLRIIASGYLPISGNRLYTWGPNGGQSLSKAERRELLIDGERAAEVDSQAHFIRLLYHLNGKDPKGDVYQPDAIFPTYWSWPNASSPRRAIVRDFVKKCTVICLNTNCRETARKGISLYLRHHPEHEFLNTVIFHTERTNITGIIDRLFKTHAPLSAAFCTQLPPGSLRIGNWMSLNWQNVGSLLMTVDGRIMMRTMDALTQASIPALAIHDSIVTKAKHIDDAQQIYAEAYRNETRFWPTLKREF